MKFLADESCDFAVVRALRAAGHDVVAIAEISPALPDEDVLKQAAQEGRVLLTEDKDFGQLVFATGAPSAGVIFIRYGAVARATLGAAVLAVIAKQGTSLVGRFGVLEPGRFRLST